MIDRVLGELARTPEADGAILAAPVTDTIKLAGAGRSGAAGDRPDERDRAGRVVETLDRDRLWAAQTPQAFRSAALRAALAVDPGQLAAATDDALLVERAGGTVLLVEAGAENLKLTTRADLRLAELLLAARSAASQESE